MDRPLRNALRSAVVECRKILEEEVSRQLEGTYGMTPKGEFLEPFAPVDDATGAAREEILASIRHIESFELPRVRAVEQFARETAFTILNRLAALKLMEHERRGLIVESVGRGKQSRGFRQFQMVSPEVCRAARNGDVLDGGYRLYLECLFDDLATELGVLFDRRLPQSLVFPSDATLARVLDILNGEVIASVWGEDETLGWIYQYFTPKELRDRARKESQAPRNSYELAFRNQFYTPRYVVEFLVDNTLGRTWYEMRQGNTRLKDACRYLVRRPNEIFLAAGEAPPAWSADGRDRTQEELLREPVSIPFREKKDPRDLRILDPACGSGHFLLYAYDLLEAIYVEAWEDEHGPPSGPTGETLRDDYDSVDELRAEIPRLILRHNVHGIDIDLRATQITALALWLRAQRSYQELGLKIAARPPIRRSNVVCAEPMPGERELLAEFVAAFQPTVLGQLVRVVFEKMKLAGEAGSLLKIEDRGERRRRRGQTAVAGAAEARAVGALASRGPGARAIAVLRRGRHHRRAVLVGRRATGSRSAARVRRAGGGWWGVRATALRRRRGPGLRLRRRLPRAVRRGLDESAIRRGEQALQAVRRAGLPAHEERRLRRLRRARPRLARAARPARRDHVADRLLPVLVPEVARGDPARRGPPDRRRRPGLRRPRHRDGRDGRLLPGAGDRGKLRPSGRGRRASPGRANTRLTAGPATLL
jgi:hypothetical protein